MKINQNKEKVIIIFNLRTEEDFIKDVGSQVNNERETRI